MDFTRLRFERQFFHHYKFITLSTNVFHETKFREILLLTKSFVRKHSGHQFYFCTLRKWHNKPTCVLYWACTLLLIRSISRNVSSLPCFTSKSCHAFQKWAVNCKKMLSYFFFPNIWEITVKTNNMTDLPSRI